MLSNYSRDVGLSPLLILKHQERKLNKIFLTYVDFLKCDDHNHFNVHHQLYMMAHNMQVEMSNMCLSSFFELTMFNSSGGNIHF